MLITPKTPSMLYTDTPSVVNAFVKLRQVEGDVASLDFGRKNFGYRGILRVSAVNFSLLPKDEQERVIEGFKGFLNSISFPLQILIRNRQHNLDNYVQMMEAVEGPLASIAHDHVKFVRLLAARRSLVRREFYIIVPADHQALKDKTESLFAAQVQLKSRMDELLWQLERMGLMGMRLTTPEIVQLYQSCYTPWEEPAAEEGAESGRGGELANSAQNGYRNKLDPSHHSSQLLAVSDREKKQKGRNAEKLAAKKAKRNKLPGFIKIPDLIIPNNFQVFPSYILIGDDLHHEYARTLAVTSYPRVVSPGWFERIIQIDEPNIDFSIHVNPLQSEPVSAHLSKKAADFRGAVLVSERQGRTADLATTIALGDMEKLRENIEHGNEHVFTVSTFIQVRGRDRRELSERSDRIARAVRSLDLRALPTHWQHLAGLMSCLPDADNQMGRGRLFGTGAASTFYPFTNSDSSMETGAMFGVQPNGALVILDPFNRQVLENGNLVIFAKSGAGKSFFLKTVTSRLLPTCNVYAIGADAEYKNMCETVKGQSVRLSSETLQINPFELYGGVGTSEAKAEENFLREKLLNLVTLLELILSDEGALSQKEKAFLYKCLIKTYENRGITVEPATHGKNPPNMQEFYLIMSNNERGVGQDYGLSERLKRYLHLFPARTQVVLDNRFIDFSMRGLEDRLRPMGLLLITEFLWIKMRQGRRSNALLPNTILLIDEVWPLMQFKQGAKFLEEVARRMHKYGGAFWCTTQKANDFLNLEEGKSMLAIAALKFLMKQDASAIDAVVRTFRLNPGQKSFLLGARRGEGLFATRSWVQMEVLASPLEAKMAHATPASALLPTQPSSRGPEQNYPLAPTYEKEDIQSANNSVRVVVDERKHNGIR